MNALRAAIGFTGRRKIAKFEGAYHGTPIPPWSALHHTIRTRGGCHPNGQTPVAILGGAVRGRRRSRSFSLSTTWTRLLALMAEHAGRVGGGASIDPLMTNDNGSHCSGQGFLQTPPPGHRRNSASC